MEHFSAYQLVWGVEVKKTGEVKYHPHSSRERLFANLNPTKGSLIYIINDRQFKLIQNSWNGEEKPLPKPFTRKIVNRDGRKISVIPLTKRQYENPIYV